MVGFFVFLQEIYAIIDAVYYSTNEYNNTNSQFCSNIPTNFKASFKFKATSNYGSRGVYFQVGEASKGILIGYGFNNQIVRIFDWQIGTSGSNYLTGEPTPNTWYTVEVEYNEGVWTVTLDNNRSMTYNKTYTTRDYVGCRTEQIGYMKDILIKAL